jgi:hypothetical protein
MSFSQAFSKKTWMAGTSPAMPGNDGGELVRHDRNAL